MNHGYERLSLEHRQLVDKAIHQCRRQRGKVYAWLDDLEAIAESVPQDRIIWELRGWPSNYVIACGIDGGVDLPPQNWTESGWNFPLSKPLAEEGIPIKRSKFNEAQTAFVL